MVVSLQPHLQGLHTPTFITRSIEVWRWRKLEMRVIGTIVCRFPWVQFLVIRNGEPENGQLISTWNWKTRALLLSLS